MRGLPPQLGVSEEKKEPQGQDLALRHRKDLALRQRKVLSLGLLFLLFTHLSSPAGAGEENAALSLSLSIARRGWAGIAASTGLSFPPCASRDELARAALASQSTKIKKGRGQRHRISCSGGGLTGLLLCCSVLPG